MTQPAEQSMCDHLEHCVVTLDCRGLLCPLPALEARKALEGVSPGEIVEIVCTDPASTIDLRALCDETGDQMIDRRETEGLYLFRIRRRPR